MLEALFNVINDIFSVSNTKDVISLVGFLIIIFSGSYVIFIYYFNKYYTRKYKNDFLYLFWGYEDKENKISSDKYLSLFIYHFITAYDLNSYKFFHKKYKFFPEDIMDMDPNSFMPNATKGNLESFEKKHIKWLKFNVISQNIIVVLCFVFFVLVYMSYGSTQDF